jgi:hypothetical protein
MFKFSLEGTVDVVDVRKTHARTHVRRRKMTMMKIYLLF